MFNLNKVYATMSFDINELKIYVFDQDNNTGCLYYHTSKIHNVFLEDYTNINDELLSKEIYEQTKKCDEFMKTPIKRYILNFTNVSLTWTTLNSRNFQVNSVLTKESYNKIINQEITAHEYCLTQQARMRIVKWTIDGVDYIEAPINIDAKTVSFTYSIIKYQHTPQLVKVIETFKKMNLQIIDITINALALAEYSAIKNALLVDIRKNKILFSFFNENGEFITANNVDIGYQNIIDNVFDKFSDRTRAKIIKNYASINRINENGFNPVVIVQHTPEILKMRSFKCDKIISLFKSSVLDEFSRNIDIFCQSNDSLKTNTVYIHTSNAFVSCAQSLFANNRFCVIANNKDSIVNENIVNLHGSIQLTHKNQSLLNKPMYSIDPFISDNISENNIKKQIQIKFGMMAINFVAKLGETYGK